MPQSPPNPLPHPDRSRLAGLPPVGVQAMQAALQAIRRGDAGEVLRLTGEVLGLVPGHPERSEEHTSELQSLMRISYAVFCLKKKKQHRQGQTTLSPKQIHQTQQT